MTFKALAIVILFTNTCFSREENVDFSNRNLTSIPQTNSVFVTHLVLSYNSLTEIKYGDFNRMINLTYLDISNNRINILNKMSFKGLTQLKVLNISSNRLSDEGSIPEGLFRPFSSSLLELDLRYNLMYKNYPEEVIKDLITLRILKLDCVNGKVPTFNILPIDSTLLKIFYPLLVFLFAISAVFSGLIDHIVGLYPLRNFGSSLHFY